MSFEPFVIDDCLSLSMHKKIELIVEDLKERQCGEEDNLVFNRRQIHNHPFFVQLHKRLLSKACEIFKEDLKASYSFLSMYGSQGLCPLHTDRPTCFRTIDLCISQKEIWPIYVNSMTKLIEFGPQHPDFDKLSPQIKATSKRYDLIPGQAICYSGTDHPHWRNPIQVDNFCDLVFFHFVPKLYEGPLLQIYSFKILPSRAIFYYIMDKKSELKLALTKEILSNSYSEMGEFREIDLPTIETYAGHPF